jgi:hypothetical protein
VDRWSTEENVIWKTPMPGFSNSSPIVVGERVYTCAEPSSLLCLSAVDGHLVWQRTSRFPDMVDAATRAQWAQEQARADAVRKEMYEAGGLLRRLGQDVQDTPDDEKLKARYQAAKARREELGKELAPLQSAWYMMPETHEENGYTSPTPTSDGERVYVVFGTGWVACYDLDGNRVWARMVEKPHMHHGYGASPVLVGDMLVVHIHHLIALDKLTGETLWQTEEESWCWGTPSRTRIGEGELLLTGCGDIVRAADGKTLASGLPRMLMQGPLVEEGIAYYLDKGAWKAYRLPEPVDGEALQPQLLWDAGISSSTCYASPVLHEGLLYSWDQSGTLRVVEADTGALVYRHKPGIGAGKSWHYPSVALAGDRLFVGADVTGSAVMFRPGRQYEELGRNTLETFCSSPVFVGDRMYLRTWGNLYCIGPSPER